MSCFFVRFIYQKSDQGDLSLPIMCETLTQTELLCIQTFGSIVMHSNVVYYSIFGNILLLKTVVMVEVVMVEEATLLAPDTFHAHSRCDPFKAI